ncbi:MAG: hypothetical protein MK077_00190 [Phycisphaerales bacterium]|nr:hypothetical protein [Phycisphaerales bacterium]
MTTTEPSPDQTAHGQGTDLVVRVGPAYSIRCTLVALICLVLGVWGVWDYVEIIPRQIRYFARADVARAYQRFAEPVISGNPEIDSNARRLALAAIVSDLKIEGPATLSTEIDGLDAAVTSGDGAAVDRIDLLLVERVVPELAKQEANRAGVDPSKIGTIASPASSVRWMAQMAAMVSGLRSPTTAAGEATMPLKAGMSAAQQTLGLYGEVEPPNSYDRPIQWLFILCLPFVPWYLYGLIQSRRRSYRLSDDGTLHLPGETWSPDDLADIDMSRWMKSSKAWVVHRDGHRVLLDDYIYKDMYRIIGAIAEARYPESWTANAKPVKKDA